MEYEGALYPLMLCSSEGKDIFIDKVDHVDFLDTIGKISKRIDFDIFLMC